MIVWVAYRTFIGFKHFSSGCHYEKRNRWINHMIVSKIIMTVAVCFLDSRIFSDNIYWLSTVRLGIFCFNRVLSALFLLGLKGKTSTNQSIGQLALCSPRGKHRVKTISEKIAVRTNRKHIFEWRRTLISSTFSRNPLKRDIFTALFIFL